MKIKEGAFYLDREGNVVGPMAYVDRHNQWPWEAKHPKSELPTFSYTNEGLHAYDFRPHRYDLIAEVDMNPTEAEIQEMIG